PGGIVVSRTVYDQVHNKLPVGFDYLGQQEMKNVAPVASYRVAMGGAAPRPEAVAAPEARDKRTRDEAEPATRMHRFADWWAGLPRPIAALLTVAGFLILINLFTNSHRIWFHWPVAALLFVCILRIALRRRPESDRRPER